MIPKRFAITLSLIAVSCCFASVSAEDWKSIRGNDGRGIAETSTLLSQSKDISLKVRWKKKIGSGYSSVVVAKDRVFTMYTDGKHDKVICLAATDGQELWSRELEAIFKGTNGSFDGPIATPVVHGSSLFCLTARGKLFALDVKTGEINWKRELVKEEQSTQPMYGFSTTPVVAGDTVCVLAGAKSGALIGLDLKTGTTKWSVGKGRINSQIPLLANMNGKKIVVTGAGQSVIGVDPDNGKQMFEFEHQGTNGSAMMPVQFDDNKLLLTNDDSFSRVFQIRPSAAGFEASELWTNKSIKNTYNVPLAYGGDLYAYSTRILTCVDQKTGKPSWKSRKPGDGFCILVDGHLVIITKKGSLHVAKADPKKYSELAKVKVFENLVWSIPAYADNAVYVRSLAEVACVEFVGKKTSDMASNEGPLELGQGFKGMLADVNAAKTVAEKNQRVETYLKEQKSFPIIEDGIAHFVFTGKANDVALACDVFGARQEKKMTRLADTELFFYTLKLQPDQRVSYIFLKDYKPITDPRNSRTMTSSMYAGEMEFAIRLANEKPLEMSWFGMASWKRPKWVTGGKAKELSGELKKESIALDKDSSTFEVMTYLPPTYKRETDRRFPVLYVHGGDAAMEKGQLHHVADQYFQAYPDKSAILVFLMSQPESQAYLGQVGNKVVPFIDKNYRSIAERSKRGTAGAGFASGSAMGLVATYSDLFGGAAIQSPLVFDQARKMSISGFKNLKQTVRLYLEWGRYDMHNPVENWDIREMAKVMQKEIGENKKVKLLGGEVNDSTDWGSWVNRFDTVLESVFN